MKMYITDTARNNAIKCIRKEINALSKVPTSVMERTAIADTIHHLSRLADVIYAEADDKSKVEKL